MPYVGKHLKRQKRKALIFFWVLIAVFTVITALSYTRLFTAINGSRITASTSGVAKSIISSTASQAPMSSSAAKESSDAKSTEVSLQDAIQPLLVHVSIEDQTLAVYDADNRVIENWPCSTGSPGYDTPKGTFSVYKRGESFYNPEYQEGAYYYVAFYKDFYIHSVPFDKDRNIIPAIANDLGHEDSHGCVHLSIEDSKWVYDNIPDGTKVVVD